MQLNLSNAFMAVSKALRDAKARKYTFDFCVLQALYGANRAVSMTYVYECYNAPGTPVNSNARYYSALERLTQKGFASVSYTLRGWRRWSITPAGRAEIDRLNKRALEYLKEAEKAFDNEVFSYSGKILMMTTQEYAKKRGIACASVRQAINKGFRLPGVLKRRKAGKNHLLTVNMEDLEAFMNRKRGQQLGNP